MKTYKKGRAFAGIVPGRPTSPNEINATATFKKVRLLGKICEECHHAWKFHLKGSCERNGTRRSARCLCGGFVKKEGDTL